MRLDDVGICENLFLEMREEVINVATSAGFLTYFYRVKTKPSWIVSHHPHGGMTAPAL
jgi:hypothetical protein